MTPRPRCSVFIACSLDGYIADAGGGIGWLEDFNRRVPAGEDCGYGAFFAGIDGLVMGRNTYETARAFTAWPYGETPVFVLTHRPLATPTAPAARVEPCAATAAALVNRLGAAGFKHLYIDGGDVIRQFLAAGLIDTLTLSRVPVLLGGGRPLFGALAAPLPLELLDSRQYPGGLVQQRYRVLGARAG